MTRHSLHRLAFALEHLRVAKEALDDVDATAIPPQLLAKILQIRQHTEEFLEASEALPQLHRSANG